MTTPDISNLIYQGQTKEITLPSGRVIILRENNGDDEGILSQLKDTKDSNNIDKYISSVVVKDLSKDKLPEGEFKGVTFAEVKKWPLNDKHYVLFAARVLSLGYEFKFKYQCQNPDCRDCKAKKKHKYTEDLKPFEVPSGGFNSTRTEESLWPMPYPKGSLMEITHTLKTGKQIQFNILDGDLQKEGMDLPEEGINKNTPLMMRHLTLIHEGEKQRCYHLRMFSSKEMAEIRSVIDEIDPDWVPIVIIECPTCKNVVDLPLLGSPDFFYPTGI